MRSIAIVLLCYLTALPLSQTTAVQDGVLSAQIDRLFARWNRVDTPGCAVAVFSRGSIIYQRGFGIADLEHGVPITPASVFYVGSVSKQFTAFAVALLAQRGRLSLNDDIRKYLPELPVYGSPITIRQLIHHTGGLPEYADLLARIGRRPEDAPDNAAVLRIVAGAQMPLFKAGDEFRYSNTGYALLAVVVERASGMRFSAFLKGNVFEPLGMAATLVRDDLSALIVNRAYGYGRTSDGGFALDSPQNIRVGVAGVYTSVLDLFKWDENFYDGRVGGLDLIKTLYETGSLNDDRRTGYAFGLYVTTYRGLRVVGHGGDLGGYRAWLKRFPDRHLTVACLCNLRDIPQGDLATQVADVFLGPAQ